MPWALFVVGVLFLTAGVDGDPTGWQQLVSSSAGLVMVLLGAVLWWKDGA